MAEPKTRDAQILIVDDDPNIRTICSSLLGREGYRTVQSATGEEAVRILEASEIDIVLTDLVLPNMSGLDLLVHVNPHKSGIDVLLMTGHPTISTAVSAMKLGAYDYVAKPFGADELLQCVDRLVERRAILSENRRMRERISTDRQMGGLVGSSPRMQQVFRQISQIASNRQSVLITGESGTGKELAARAIHDLSPWRDEPFVVVDCGGLPSNLIESELFGHTRGAFTGAHLPRRGLFAKAGKGTLFLDEVGELPIDLQVKLLRVLQEKQYRPVGSDEVRQMDARILAATNIDPEQAVTRGALRKDLYYRLNVHRLSMPPLRERRGDIPTLILHLLARHITPPAESPGLSPEALAALARYRWPGNVREMENCAQRLLATGSPLIRLEHLPPEIAGEMDFPSSLSYLQEVERQAISDVLESTRGNVAKAAHLLGVAKTTVYRKLKEYDLQVPGQEEDEDGARALGAS